jgi:hypothetical protein
MKQYRNPADNSIWAYELDGSQDDLIPATFVPLSDAEVLAILAALEATAEAEEAARVPDSVTPFQAKAALLNAGLLDAVLAAIAAAPRITQLAWAEATEFRRTSPTVLMLAGALGLTSTQLDDLFKAAKGIEA